MLGVDAVFSVFYINFSNLLKPSIMNNYLFLFFRYKWSDNNPLSEQNIKKKSIKAKNIDSACKKMLNYIEKSDANLGFRIDQEVEVNEKIIDISGNLSLEKYF